MTTSSATPAVFTAFDWEGDWTSTPDAADFVEAHIGLFARLAAWKALGYTAFHLKTDNVSTIVPMDALMFDAETFIQYRIKIGEGLLIVEGEDTFDIFADDVELGPLYITIHDHVGETVQLTATNQIDDPALDTQHSLTEIGSAIADHERLLAEKIARARASTSATPSTEDMTSWAPDLEALAADQAKLTGPLTPEAEQRVRTVRRLADLGNSSAQHISWMMINGVIKVSDELRSILTADRQD